MKSPGAFKILCMLFFCLELTLWIIHVISLTLQEEMGGSARKEKSVLQAKLTKLAIQIGYAGKETI